MQQTAITYLTAKRINKAFQVLSNQIKSNLLKVEGPDGHYHLQT